MHRRILISGLATVAAATGGVLTGVTPASASSGGNINVVYQVQGGTNALTTLVNTAKTEFQKQYPGWTVTLTPITSPAENDYYTKLDLMNQSASTAPNVMYEDTFLVNSDVAAGYLAPIDSYLAKWSGWKEFSPAAQAAAKGANGHIYGVSMGTDTRGLYYNKQISPRSACRSRGIPQAGLRSWLPPRRSRPKIPGSPRSTSTEAWARARARRCRASKCSCTGPTTGSRTPRPPSGKRPGPASKPRSPSTKPST